ncbi:MAG: efflux RND transporter periplasmic adaptor subunit [Bacillota bacterium]
MHLLKKWGIWVLVVVIITASAWYGWQKYSVRRASANQGSQMMTVKVERGNLQVRVTGTGAVQAANQEEIRTRMSGTINRMAMKDGQQVQAGQVLAELDVQDLSLQIDKARLDITIQERELAKLRQEKTVDTVTAPGSGDIAWKVKAGDRVQEGAIIATLQDKSRMEIVGRFNSAQVEHIKAGQTAEVFLPEFLSTLSAKVVEVNASPRAGTGGSILYDVRAEIKNPGGLTSGMKARLSVVTGNGTLGAVEDSVLSLPEPVDLRAPITGKIQAIRVENGRTVALGQSLAEISDSDRADKLVDQIATAELRLQQARLDLEDKERQQRERNQNRLVLAPIDGTVVLPAKPVGVGDSVNQGTVFGRIVDYSQMQVVIPVDELDVAKVRPGQRVRLTAAALPGKNISGEVLTIAAQGTSQSGVATFDVTIKIEPTQELKVGMTVNAEIVVEQRQNVLLVPIEAVNEQRGRSMVMVPGEPGEDGKPGSPRPVQVRTGAYDATRIEILEGLQEGQQVLIQAAQSRAGNIPVIRVPGMGTPAPGGGNFNPQSRPAQQRGGGQ